MNLDFSVIEQGGPIMWLLLTISVVGFVLFVERLFFLHKGHINTGSFVEGITNVVKKRRLVEALTICEENPSPISNIIKSALLNYDQPKERLFDAVQTAALVEIPYLQRRIGTLAVVARVAPLLGLLGTLLSIMSTFYQLQTDGPYANSADYAGFMAQALITTIFGVGIAIMAQLAHHFLHGRFRALVHDIEWVGHDMIQLIANLDDESDEIPESKES
ncbi:MAG: MotA/TolQ/ExbB proton channel family protein [Opitutales bacterium]|nr:MotA/TolQ/ExbB proton channel family protein [Opitutales bacterium]